MYRISFPKRVAFFKLRYPLISAAIKALITGVPIFIGITSFERTYATTIPSSTQSVQLQLLDPNTAIFVAPVSTTINSPDVGIYGDNSKNWQLTNRGSITGNGTGSNTGISLDSASAGAAKLDNFGTVISTGTAPGVVLRNGGTLANHLGGNISSAGSIGITSGVSAFVLVNDGAIGGATGGLRSGKGASITQSATGTISSPGGFGVLIDDGTVTINNAGSITGAEQYGLVLRGATAGTVVNTGTISGALEGVVLQGTAP